MAAPATKAARHAAIAGILAGPGAPVRSQDELAERLAARGFRVTQATLSRDLVELGTVRLRGPDGALVYALPTGPVPVPAAGGSPLGPSPPQASTAAGGAGGSSPWASTAAGGAGGSSPWASTAAGGAGGSSPWASTVADGPLNAGISALARGAADLLLSAEASGNLVVVRTPPGAAQLVASLIDRAGMQAVLGTVAGDDTVLIVAREVPGGAELASALLRLAERPRRQQQPRA